MGAASSPVSSLLSRHVYQDHQYYRQYALKSSTMCIRDANCNYGPSLPRPSSLLSKPTTHSTRGFAYKKAYRLVESSAGIDPNTNPLPNNERYFPVSNATPVFLALLLMNLVHPRLTLVRPNSEIPKGKSRKEESEVKKARKETAKAEEAQESPKTSRKIGCGSG